MNPYLFPRLKKGVIALFALAVVQFYYFFDPTTTLWGPPCLLRSVTGWQCWGCGGQRAFHALLHGNFHRAFQLNALVYPVIILLGYVLMMELAKQNPSYPLIRTRGVSLSLFMLVAGFTILRNL